MELWKENARHSKFSGLLSITKKLLHPKKILYSFAVSF